MNDAGFYMSLFKVDGKILDSVTDKALSSGAGYADLYFEHTASRDLVLRDSAVCSCGFHVDYGVGIRALDGESTGYSYCETTEKADMLAAAAAAAAICRRTAPAVRHTAVSSAMPVSGNFYKPSVGWTDSTTERLAAFLLALDTRLHSADNRIKKVIARISASESHILMYNSLRETAFDSRPVCSIAVSIVVSDGKSTDQRSSSRSFRTGVEFFSDELARELAGELTKGIDSCLQARKPRGGQMPVVMGAGASGILLHEAMGHAFEADFNRKGQSVFHDKMGSRICPESINIVDDATVTGNRGSCNFDDEGVPGQKTYMVRNGVLDSYLHDRISAAHYGIAPTGNGRRESFRFNPLPRMRLTYMENGDADPEAIIHSVRKGIYVDEFSNGQVKIGEGDFTFYVKSGFLIEDGRLTMPVKDINVIGNGPQALADIVAAGNDLKIDNGTWICGKDQNVPVGCGMPTVLVRKLTVGGE